MLVWRHISAVSGGYVDASLPSRNAFHCPLSAQGYCRSVGRASLEEVTSGSLLIKALATERQVGRLCLLLFKHSANSSRRARGSFTLVYLPHAAVVRLDARRRCYPHTENDGLNLVFEYWPILAGRTARQRGSHGCCLPQMTHSHSKIIYVLP